MGETIWVVLAVIFVLLVTGIWGLSRLRRLTTAVGTFDCSYRTVKPTTASVDAWAHGLCEYQSDRLQWWRIYSLSIRPSKTWLREGFDLTGRVPLDQADMPGLYLVQCRYNDVPFELMMSTEAYHGLASWVESAPPSARGYDY